MAASVPFWFARSTGEIASASKMIAHWAGVPIYCAGVHRLFRPLDLPHEADDLWAGKSENT